MGWTLYPGGVASRKGQRGRCSIGMYLVCATALLAVLYECTCYPVRRYVSDLCIGHVVVVVRSPVVHQPHAHRTWHEGKILKHGCRCAAAAAVLLYTVFFCGCEAERL